MSTREPADGPVFEGKRTVHVRDVRRLERLAAITAVVASMVLGCWLVLPDHIPWMLLLTPLPMGIIFLLDGALIAVKEGHVATTREGGVLVDGSPALPAGSFVEAVYEPAVVPAAMPASPLPALFAHPASGGSAIAAGGGLVRFMGKRRRTLFAVAVRDEEEARRLLAATGADVAGRDTFTAPAASVTEPRPSKRLLHPAVVIPMAFSLLSTVSIVTLPLSSRFAWWAIPFALLPVFVVLVTVGRRITVSADALSIRNPLPLSTTTRLPLAELTSVEPVGEGSLRLVRAGAPETVLHLGSSRLLEGERLVSLRDLIVSRIRDALAHHQRSRELRDLTGQLARGARSLEAWVDELRQLRATLHEYRSPSVRDDDLWSVIENPAVPDDARAAAALLLDRDEAARQRLRVTATTASSPRLRVALDRISRVESDADSTLEDEVAKLTVEPPPRSRRMFAGRTA